MSWPKLPRRDKGTKVVAQSLEAHEPECAKLRQRLAALELAFQELKNRLISLEFQVEKGNEPPAKGKK